ncbi:RING finger and SPRY domain-containing protein 1 [Ceratitis capitata]|uniref:RING finger and SPRY domain-containing protein 1 n=1 Tax=Ceratitis capitata TaxID=7213 RepID=W8BZY8_CERCA|nr:RING finger and SPRY domain-containing protein 1 [Ceratitis capitata]
MGSCLCKDKNDSEEDNDTGVGRSQQRHARGSLRNSYRNPEVLQTSASVKTLSDTVDKLVRETLDVISTMIDNEPEPPNSILMLHSITEKPAGWIELVRSLMRVVPVEHPMGPSVIALLLDDSPLPTKESVLKVGEMVAPKYGLKNNLRKERNLCVIIGCLAEKLAGPSSIALLNNSMLKYLISNLNEDIEPNVKLLSLIALEKFAQTSENKVTIQKTLQDMKQSPFLTLEEYVLSTSFLLRQIGFCACWCLDNYFPVSGRQYSYENTDVSKINAMLNTKDVSEYLKISADGLEARCDAYTFESVRCTFQITKGCWYYEVLLITPGVMQIGWATKESSFLSDDGYGIGDDKYSIGFDGCRRIIWHNAKSIPHSLPTWKSGSILGCLLDLEKQEVIFTLDGESTDPYRHIFNSVKQGFFAAASFMSFQQCRFNFGLEPFRYPPQRAFTNFNESGMLSSSDKIILPRHIYLDMLRKVSVRDDSCTLCFDKKATMRLEPCSHRGFCVTCTEQLKFCPMCRSDIRRKVQECTDSPVNVEVSDVEAIQTET